MAPDAHPRPHKRVVVLLRSSPEAGSHAAEALRAALGLTLRGDEVTVLLLGDGVELLRRLAPAAGENAASGPYRKPLATLRAFGHQLCAEIESLDQRGLELAAARLHARLLSRAEVVPFLEAADAVEGW